MTHVVTEPCIRCRYTDCVESCPVDCFHVGPSFVVIDPEVCIDCALCVPACPVQAIRHADELTLADQDFLALNANLARAWPVLAHPLPPPADAELWRRVTDKRRWLASDEILPPG
ncbi:4Fe-4S ferredoxin iron-sulfur binding domain-containing protein [mine drainage metagenome]|uniref:4Fe-4S ferredoxin iron-sulfur binding domain-containing protein n=1 Tax=mine drainage metagenome TaxID=410659 RepID=T0ZF79_9ZZZZ